MAEFEQEVECAGRRSLGSWFPTASVQKAAQVDAESSTTIALFYQYIHQLWSEDKMREAIRFVERQGALLGIGGRVRVGREGINATISGENESVRNFTKALNELDDHFRDTDFKYIENLAPDRAFKDLKVLPVKELVFYGISAEENLGDGGVHLPPEQYHQKLAEEGTVVIDIRNAYESDIGNFGGQEKCGGAKLICPDVRKSTDFPAWMRSADAKEQMLGKNVLMYCTGGVRCERASAFLKREMGDSVKGVYQLHGGIEKYLQTYPDGGFWEGKNFVFDKREAIGVGYESGVGGVVTKSYMKELKDLKSAACAESSSAKKKRKVDEIDAINNNVASKKRVLGSCCSCGDMWDRYVGKKKCLMCGVPVLLCDKCLTNKVDKTPGMELRMRCRICVKENITVPASLVEFTNNGIQTKTTPIDQGDVKAASTVCKWGGGHARSKKINRKKERSNTVNKVKLKDQPCRFGRDCTRENCWFSHEV